MAERAAQVRRSAVEKACSSSEQQVLCDVCTERQLNIKEIKQSVKLGKEDADKVKIAGAEAFTALIESVKASLAQFIKTIEGTQRERAQKAEGFIKVLEEEISELMRDSSNVQKLSNIKEQVTPYQSITPLPLPV
ncbi:uncharacterized protein [Nothobranchius furzeri]|uniref:uncharacterized protein n=1 Tax=Nothobranchius furzeri TaxID=105023 RepID=UPI003904B909